MPFNNPWPESPKFVPLSNEESLTLLKEMDLLLTQESLNSEQSVMLLKPQPLVTTTPVSQTTLSSDTMQSTSSVNVSQSASVMFSDQTMQSIKAVQLEEYILSIPTGQSAQITQSCPSKSASQAVLSLEYEEFKKYRHVSEPTDLLALATLRAIERMATLTAVPHIAKLAQRDLSSKLKPVKCAKQLDDLIDIMDKLLTETIVKNINQPRKLSKFDANSPATISINAYIRRHVKHLDISEEILIATYVLIRRYMKKNPEYHLTYFNFNRLFAVSILLAHKFHHDNPFVTAAYAKIAGITCSEMKDLEVELFLALECELNIDPIAYLQYKNFFVELSSNPIFQNPAKEPYTYSMSRVEIKMLEELAIHSIYHPPGNQNAVVQHGFAFISDPSFESCSMPPISEIPSAIPCKNEQSISNNRRQEPHEAVSKFNGRFFASTATPFNTPITGINNNSSISSSVVNDRGKSGYALGFLDTPQTVVAEPVEVSENISIG